VAGFKKLISWNNLCSYSWWNWRNGN